MRILSIIGTRPEAIKMAPVALRLRAQQSTATHDCRICITAQYRSMLDNALQAFGLTPDHDLAVMTSGQTPSAVASEVLKYLDPVLTSFQPDWVLVQGDTTTTMAAALAAFHRQIAVAHVEAGSAHRRSVQSMA